PLDVPLEPAEAVNRKLGDVVRDSGQLGLESLIHGGHIARRAVRLAIIELLKKQSEIVGRVALVVFPKDLQARRETLRWNLGQHGRGMLPVTAQRLAVKIGGHPMEGDAEPGVELVSQVLDAPGADLTLDRRAFDGAKLRHDLGRQIGDLRRDKVEAYLCR